MRVGLFGGTFNPVHSAHLRVAEEVREALALDRVEFVLAAVPPHKNGGALESVEHRHRMLELALAGNPAFAVNTTESERPGCSYSVDTIRARQARETDTRLTFILGADAFGEFESWKEFATIFALCDVCVLSRPGTLAAGPPIAVAKTFCYDQLRRVYVHESGNSLVFLPVASLAISASDIRQRCGSGRSIRYLVPDAVGSYIASHGLYGTRASTS